MVVGARVWLLAVLGCSGPPALAPGDGGGSDGAARSDGGIPVTSDGAIDGPSCAPFTALESPDVCRPWAGVVIGASATPLMATAIDGVVLPEALGHDFIIDTRLLSDGPHELTLTPGGTAQFIVENGPPVAPPFTGQFVDVTVASGILATESFPVRANPVGAIAVDLDGTGGVDVVAWRYSRLRAWRQTTTLAFVPFGPALDIVVQAAGSGDLDGDGRPEIVAAGDRLHIFAAGPGSTALRAVGTFPTGGGHDYRSVTFADIDADGLLDLAIGDFSPTGRSLVLRNEGNLVFRDITDALGLAIPGGKTYSLAMDAPTGDGALEVWAYEDGGREPFTARFRFVPGVDLPVVESQWTYPFIQPMGSAWFDVDRDGALELWLAGDNSSPIYAAPTYDHSVTAHLGAEAILGAVTNRTVSAWAMALVDFDLDGQADFYRTNDPSDPAGEPGDARDTLWWRAPSGRFIDVAELVALGGVQNCRGVFPADLDADGDVDLLVGCAPGLRVLRNDLVDPAPARRVVLRGTSSNVDGVNARITGPGGELRLVRGGGQPFAGGVVQEVLAANTGTITVAWPSGVVQTVAVGAGRVINVVEPEVVRVMPRRTGSGSSVSVEVDPEAFGAPPGSDVEITVSAGVWSQAPAPGADARWRGELTTPPAPATVVVSVVIDGVAVGVRPRIFVR